MVAPEGAITRLLITRHDKIGDFVLALPLCKAIKIAYPQMQISVLVSKVNSDFAQSLDFIDNVILYSEDFRETLANIKEQQFDASISCFIDSRLGYLLWRAAIPRRIAPATKLAQLYFNECIVQRRSRVEKTEWQYNLDLGRNLLKLNEPAFTPPLIQFQNVAPKNRVVLHPGSGGSSDGNLRIDDYLSLAKRASQVPELEVVFTFGPDDQETYHRIKSLLDFPATLIQSNMRLIGLSLQYLTASQIIEIQNQLRVTFKCHGCGYIFDAVAFPKAIAVAEGFDATLGTDARTTQYNNMDHGLIAMEYGSTDTSVFILLKTEKSLSEK